MSMAAAPPPSPPWTELPDDLTENILQRLRTEEIMNAQLVCSTWWRICKNPSMWRVINLDCRHWEDDEFDGICRYAVDCSQGQLAELMVTSFAEDRGFLNYVADRSSQLRCLTLVEYDKIETALIDAIKKLPQLEELHLIKMPSISINRFETICVYCRMLKSFTYNEHWDEGTASTKYAVAIGKYMPNLLHLRLWGLWTKNRGLEAILDGCPSLELLDLRRCSGLDLEGALGERCFDQVKHLRLPSDSIDDIDWFIKYPDDDEFDHEYGCDCNYAYGCYCY
ncbi:putative F-box/LRR-repeat protein 23 [Salvia divinorum]|uniref:F-box/LRR-repeat protein 23 n=1 Tax=Salvia divinorum TaxID=28513 RepID=A0ABD1HH67_SALDI